MCRIEIKRGRRRIPSLKDKLPPHLQERKKLVHDGSDARGVDNDVIASRRDLGRAARQILFLSVYCLISPQAAGDVKAEADDIGGRHMRALEPANLQGELPDDAQPANQGMDSRGNRGHLDAQQGHSAKPGQRGFLRSESGGHLLAMMDRQFTAARASPAHVDHGMRDMTAHPALAFQLPGEAGREIIDTFSFLPPLGHRFRAGRDDCPTLM